MPYKGCYEIYVSSTRKIRVSDTVNFYPTDDFLMPGSSPQADVLSAFQNLTTAITEMVPLSSQPISKHVSAFVSSLNKFKLLFLEDNDSSQIVLDDDPPPGYQPRLMLPISFPSTPISPVHFTEQAYEPAYKPPIQFPINPPPVLPDFVPRMSARIQAQHPHNYRDMHTGRALSAFFKDPINIQKIVTHTGTFNNIKRPLLFRVRYFHSSAKYDKWLTLDNVITTLPYQSYISSTPHF